MVAELPDIHRVDYDDFMQGDPSTPYVWSDGTPGATSPDALNRLQAYYAARLGNPTPKSTHVHLVASKLASGDKVESGDVVASGDTPQHVRDYHYHSYLAGAAANYDPSTAGREYGYEDKFGACHAMTTPAHH